MNLPSPTSLLSFSFALGSGEVLLISLSSTVQLLPQCLYHLPVVHLTLDVGYLLIATQAPCSHHSSTSRDVVPLASVAHGVPRQSSALGLWKGGSWTQRVAHEGWGCRHVVGECFPGWLWLWVLAAVGAS